MGQINRIPSLQSWNFSGEKCPVKRQDSRVYRLSRSLMGEETWDLGMTKKPPKAVPKGQAVRGCGTENKPGVRRGDIPRSEGSPRT